MATNIQNQFILTLEEAAQFLRVDADKLLEVAKGGYVPGRQISGQWRFVRAALINWLACVQSPPSAATK